MKKITCVGYHATGSGAVDDFLREFDNIESAKYGVEFRILQDPDGISDLEYNLVDNPHRLNSGFAIKRFIKLCKSEKRGYERIFGKEWMPWVNEYVNDLTCFNYKGNWRADIRIQSDFKKFIYKIRRVINLLIPIKYRKTKYYNYFPNEITYFSNLEKKEFELKTRNNFEKLCDFLNKENKEYVVLDQAVSPQNIERYSNYIKDLKIIVVDRDPRDVYINDILKNNDCVLPYDILKFCEVYKFSRKNVNKNLNNALFINFEDMIYKYDETTKKIMDFLGLKEENHKYPMKFFDPQKSKNNTRLWNKSEEYLNSSKIIEKELKDYLY